MRAKRYARSSVLGARLVLYAHLAACSGAAREAEGQNAAPPALGSPQPAGSIGLASPTLCLGRRFQLEAELNRDFSLELRGPAVEVLRLEGIESLAPRYEKDQKHLLPAPGLIARRAGRSELEVAIVPVEGGPADAGSKGLRPAPDPAASKPRRVERLSLEVKDCGDAPGFELGMDHPVYYFGNTAKIELRAGAEGWLFLQERGIEGLLYRGRFKEGQARTLPAPVTEAPGLHELELLYAETSTLASAKRVAEAAFQVRGPRWARLEAVQVKLGRSLPVSANQRQFEPGEALVLTTELPKSGHILVVQVDAEDQMTVLYPNRRAPKSKVDAGSIEIPSKDARFDLVASPPRGDVQVVVLLSPAPLLSLVLEGPGESYPSIGDAELALIEKATAAVGTKYPDVQVGRVDLTVR